MTDGICRGSTFTHDSVGEDYDISMTWPMYRHHECRYNGRIVKLRPQGAELLSILLVRRGTVVEWADLIEAMWPDADDQPEAAANHIQVVLCYVRRVLPNVVVTRWGSGLMIEKPAPHTMDAEEERLLQALAA